MTKSNYIDNVKFYDALVEYKKSIKVALEAGKSKPVIPEYIARCFMLIAENLGNLPRYSQYPCLDQMISDGIEACVRYCANFDETRPEHNPFGYYSQICIYAFHRRIGLEKKQVYTKYKLVQQYGLNEGTTEIEDDDNELQSPEMYANMDEFIRKFENKLQESREKNKQAKGIEACMTKDKS